MLPSWLLGPALGVTVVLVSYTHTWFQWFCFTNPTMMCLASPASVGHKSMTSDNCIGASSLPSMSCPSPGQDQRCVVSSKRVEFQNETNFYCKSVKNTVYLLVSSENLIKVGVCLVNFRMLATMTGWKHFFVRKLANYFYLSPNIIRQVK
jgi:ABC-type sugar transport system permease subunit